jgi:acyl-CoA thioesterase FadM
MDAAATSSPARLWTRAVLVRFSHCDPAGIVYFASYFDVINGVIEDWFGEALGLPYHELIMKRRIGLGYAHSGCDFLRPGRMGEVHDYAVAVERVGTKSLPLRVTAEHEGVPVLKARMVIVATDLDSGRSIPLPEDVRAAVTAYHERTA